MTLTDKFPSLVAVKLTVRAADVVARRPATVFPAKPAPKGFI